jgi:hypothetical protein
MKSQFKNIRFMKNYSPAAILALLISIFVNFSFTYPVNAQSNTLIHFWYFDNSLPNDTPLSEINAFYSIVGNNQAKLEYLSALAGYPFTSTHSSWRKASMERRNVPTSLNYRPAANNGQPFVADHLKGIQIKQPFSGDAGGNTLIFHAPTPGVKNIIFKFAAYDEGAAKSLLIDYSVAAGNPSWITSGLSSSTLTLETQYQLYTIDFSDIEQVNDNSSFKIRIRFQGDNMTVEDGGRVNFNNFSIDGDPLSDNNLPPAVRNPLSLQKLTQGVASSQIDLNSVFTDPNNDNLTYTAISSHNEFVTAQVNQNTLILNPLKQAGAVITVSASDGVNPAASHSFRVLIYPQAFHLAESGNFTFEGWNNDEPEYAYPSNMLFLQSDRADPPVDYELLYPYFIPHDDYHADDQNAIGFPYKVTARTRINGLGANGITFLNTGRNRDLGGVIVALDTRNQTSLSLNFTAGTIARNSRIYAFRLQYRTDINEAFKDVVFNNQPVEYVAGNDGTSQDFNNILLPSELLGHEYVQLLWRYALKTGDTGARSHLRLAQINISGTTQTINYADEDNFRIYLQNNLLHIDNTSGEKATVSVFNTSGSLVHNTIIDSSGINIINTSLNPGIYLISVQTNTKKKTVKIFIP